MSAKDSGKYEQVNKALSGKGTDKDAIGPVISKNTVPGFNQMVSNSK